ncbi:Hypp9025 [Branchiostoma lanceolatum]|uniref:Hypp9025 protein n=1 Tax=Branchiostoma lanceolatum TaxID=7740 RepID=A0A8K0EFM5_BRALA|nr:Hypp9025 [Branchiostoma lanceolatum]
MGRTLSHRCHDNTGSGRRHSLEEVDRRVRGAEILEYTFYTCHSWAQVCWCRTADVSIAVKCCYRCVRSDGVESSAVQTCVGEEQQVALTGVPQALTGVPQALTGVPQAVTNVSIAVKCCANRASSVCLASVCLATPSQPNKSDTPISREP